MLDARVFTVFTEMIMSCYVFDVCAVNPVRTHQCCIYVAVVTNSIVDKDRVQT